MSNLVEFLDVLERRANKLGCFIITYELSDWEPVEGLDFGPYFIVDECGYRAWEHGLPLEGIADALSRIELELRLEAQGHPDPCVVWRNFGASWLDRYGGYWR